MQVAKSYFQRIFLLLFISVLSVNGQTEDTLRLESRTIELADVSIRSAEVVVEIDRVIEGLIGAEELMSLKFNTLKLIRLNDSILLQNKNVEEDDVELRFLENKEIFWRKRLGHIEEKKIELADLIRKIDKERYAINEELLVWENTKDSSSVYSELALKRIEFTINYLTKSVDELTQKGDLMMSLLDKLTRAGMDVEEQYSALVLLRELKEERLFERESASLMKLKYISANDELLQASFDRFIDSSIEDLKVYLQHNTRGVIIVVMLCVVFYVGFYSSRKRLVHIATEKNGHYLSLLQGILSNPLSGAVLMALFSTVFVFWDRPLIFRDIVSYLVLMPLLILSRKLIAKKYHVYLYLFAFVMILQSPLIVLSNQHALSRVSMLLVSVLELYALGRLMVLFKKQVHTGLVKLAIAVTQYVLFTLALVGFVGNIAGFVSLATLALLALSSIVLAAGLIYLTLCIVTGLSAIALESEKLNHLVFIQKNKMLLQVKFVRLVNGLASISFLIIVLDRLNIYRSIYDNARLVLEKEWAIGSTTFSLKTIFVFFLVIYISVVISRLIKGVLEEDVLSKLSLPKGVPHTISVMVRYTMITIGLFMAISIAGISFSSLAIIFGALSVGIGFGLQNIFNNLVSGLILLFERPIQIGDTVEVGELVGEVKSMGIRSSNVRTYDGAEVIVPNGQLISNEVVNWTLSDSKRRVEVNAGVTYSADPHQVSELFLSVLMDHKDVISDPEPVVLFHALGESSLDFRLLFWTRNFTDWLRIKSEITFKVFDILKENNIEIPFPQRDLHLRSSAIGNDTIGLK